MYLNPHRIFRTPSLIWRLAEDLLDLMPETVTAGADVVAGPVMGGALLAHTMAGLLDSRRSLERPPTSFAPLSLDAAKNMTLRPFYRTVVRGKRVLLADDVRNTGKTFERAKTLIEEAGAMVIASAQIYVGSSHRRSRRANFAGRVRRQRTTRPPSVPCAQGVAVTKF